MGPSISPHMMRKPNLQSIQKKIQVLQGQAERIRKTESRGVIQKIKAAIEHYGLKVEELFGTGSGKKRGRPAGKKAATAKKPNRKTARRKIAVKYRDSSGNTWTGRGSHPRWLTAALKEGKKIEDFAVKR